MIKTVVDLDFAMDRLNVGIVKKQIEMVSNSDVKCGYTCLLI